MSTGSGPAQGGRLSEQCWADFLAAVALASLGGALLLSKPSCLIGAGMREVEGLKTMEWKDVAGTEPHCKARGRK